MRYKKILVVGVKGTSTNILFNYLDSEKLDPQIIIEERISKVTLIKNRVKKLGIIKVFGQLLFQVCVSPILKILASKRLKEIKKRYNLNTSDLEQNKINYVSSVNSQETIDVIIHLKPDLIILSGCRIISNRTLSKIDVPIINIHAGITPKYRGVHGGYWAVREQDLEGFGVTIHHVDKGIDTGNIISQKRIKIDRKDNFKTYPLIQIAEGLTLLKYFIENGQVERFDNAINKSLLWYHPTLWGYLYYRIFKGNK